MLNFQIIEVDFVCLSSLTKELVVQGVKIDVKETQNILIPKMTK